MVKIAVAGIGAVGGYFGGLLAKRYAGSADVQVYFIARGENERVIRERGLRIETPENNWTAHPALCTSNCAEIGTVDYLLISTKNYSLPGLLAQLGPCIKAETILLPLLNGVEAADLLQQQFPENEVWKGCVYLVARLTEPGLVTDSGSISQLHFGSNTGTKYKLEHFGTLLKDAGIDARLSADIESTTWEKYLFIATMATLTAYLDKNFGQVREDPQAVALFDALLNEAAAVAAKRGVQFKEDIKAKTKAKLMAARYESTSSMHSDFKKGGPTELESITGYMIREANRLGIEVPTFTKVYQALKLRA